MWGGVAGLKWIVYIVEEEEDEWKDKGNTIGIAATITILLQSFHNLESRNSFSFLFFTSQTIN